MKNVNASIGIVQLPHPGAEHGPDVGTPDHRSWNQGAHRRKFMKCRGWYCSASSPLPTQDDLLFWGEWEPPSRVQRLPTGSGSREPKWLHEPYVPHVIASAGVGSNCKGSTKKQCNCGGCNKPSGLQNTDPFVFEKSFKYFICKQSRKNHSASTRLSRLGRGSLILFGSTVLSPVTGFELDTVFVVADWIDYDPCEINRLQRHPRVSELYNQLVISRVFPENRNQSTKLRLYFGATARKPVDGLYSFVPARVVGSKRPGFARVLLSKRSFLKDNLNSAPKFTQASPEDVAKAWHDVRNACRSRGCVEAVEFKVGHG